MLCKICNLREVVYLPFCEDAEGNQFFYGVCTGCRDSVPYKVIPVKTTLDTGYFHCPNMPIEFKLTKIDPDSFNPYAGIRTRYGKKLLREGAKYYGKITIDNLLSPE